MDILVYLLIDFCGDLKRLSENRVFAILSCSGLNMLKLYYSRTLLV